jgi:2'-5' RNA ligase
VADALAHAAEVAVRTREGREVRPSAARRIHLTCAFLGDVAGQQVGELADQLADVATTTAPSELTIDRAGHFGDRVLWASTSEPPDDVKSLAKAVRIGIRSAGLSVQGNEFRPHLTVARTRQDTVMAPLVARLQDELSASPVTWRANDLCLVSSVRAASATYEVLERWQLT